MKTLPLRIRVNFYYMLIPFIIGLLFPFTPLLADTLLTWFAMLVMILHGLCVLFAPFSTLHLASWFWLIDGGGLLWYVLALIFLFLPLLGTLFFNKKPEIYSWLTYVPWFASLVFCGWIALRLFSIASVLIFIKDLIVLILLIPNRYMGNARGN